MSKFNIGDVLKKVVDVGSEILPVPGGKVIGDMVENVIDELTDGPDGKEKDPGNRQGHNGNRRMNRRRQAK